MPRKAIRTWLLIADGRRAKVFETDAQAAEFRGVEDMAREASLPKSRDILTDKPGRTFDSVGAGRHAKESPTDPRRQLKREFADLIVGELRKAMRAKRFDRLILVAPPAFMGDLREELPKDLKDKVAGEVTSDLTNTPEQDLPSHLREILGHAA
jgi:protein required for attachment to host cells